MSFEAAFSWFCAHLLVCSEFCPNFKSRAWSYLFLLSLEGFGFFKEYETKIDKIAHKENERTLNQTCSIRHSQTEIVLGRQARLMEAVPAANNQEWTSRIRSGDMGAAQGD